MDVVIHFCIFYLDLYMHFVTENRLEKSEKSKKRMKRRKLQIVDEYKNMLKYE